MREETSPTGSRHIMSSIRQRIEHGGERLWRPDDFREFSFMAVAQALSRLKREGELERLSKGVYYRTRETAFGMSRPNPAAVRNLVANIRPYILPVSPPRTFWELGKAEIEALIANITEQIGGAKTTPSVSTVPSKSPVKKARKKRKLSPEARAGIAKAQKLRWAKFHAAQKVTTEPAPAAKKATKKAVKKTARKAVKKAAKKATKKATNSDIPF